MTQASPLPPDQNELRQNDENTSARPVPWLYQPFFWILLGMLAGALAFFFLLKLHSPPVSVPDALSSENRRLQEQVVLQRARNRGLEEEIRRLHGLLSEDPCSISGILGHSPEVSPAVPDEKENRPDSPVGSPPSSHSSSSL